LHSKLLFSSVTSISIARVSVGSVRDVGSLNWLAGGLGDLVLDWRAGDLGDGVAVLHLDRDQLDLGVVNAVLGGDLTASMLHSCLDGVGYSVGNWGDSWVSSVSSEKLRISFSIGISLTFAIVIGSMSDRSCRSVTKGINNLLADLLVLNLFSIDNLGVAHVLGSRYASLCYEDLNTGDTVSSRHYSSSVVRSSSQELRVSLGICLGSGCCASHGKETREGK